MGRAHNEWFLGPGMEGMVERLDVVIKATYSLVGAAAGAPRCLTYWRLGPWVRAEQDGRLLWLEGPDGVMGELTPGSLTRIEDGQVFRPPVHELDALRSTHEAAGWLGIHSAPSAGTPELHRATGRRSLVHTWAEHRLRVAVDEEMGCVLELSAEGIRGPMALHTTSFELLTPDPAWFTPPQVGD